MVIALHLFEILDVVLEFLPAMTELALQIIRTAISVSEDFLIAVPVGTDHGLLFRRERSLKVLPVVGIDASESVMVDFGKRTELRLKIE